MRSVFVLAALLCSLSSTAIGAGMTVFDDKAAFLAQTAATPATTIPSTPYTFFPQYTGFTSGDLSFSLDYSASSRFIIDDWTSQLPGSELGISGLENFGVDIGIVTGPVFAFGFDFVEPELDPNVNAPFVDSTFNLIMKSGSTTVANFSFERPNDSAQFVGIWVDASGPFDSVELRETVGDIENEFFGQFYTGLTPIPEPATFTLLGLGSVVFVFAMVRQRKHVV